MANKVYSQETCHEAEVGLVYQFDDDPEFNGVDIIVGVLNRTLPHSHYAFMSEEAADGDIGELQWAYCRAVPKELLGA